MIRDFVILRVSRAFGFVSFGRFRVGLILKGSTSFRGFRVGCVRLD